MSQRKHAESINLLAILAIAALTALIVTSNIPEWPAIYYRVDKGVVDGRVCVIVLNDRNVRTKVACENFTQAELKRTGGYAQK